MIYLDTSVIAPFYWPEALSDVVERLLRTEDEALAQSAEALEVEVQLLSFED